MSEIVGGPIKLRICEDCPNRSKVRSMSARQGQAKVTVDEDGLTAMFNSSAGKAGFFRESATNLYLADSSVADIFCHCSGPVKEGFLQRIGLSTPDCPALEELVGGDPADGDIIAQYQEKLLDQ